MADMKNAIVYKYLTWKSSLIAGFRGSSRKSSNNGICTFCFSSVCPVNKNGQMKYLSKDLTASDLYLSMADLQADRTDFCSLLNN